MIYVHISNIIELMLKKHFAYTILRSQLLPQLWYSSRHLINI